MRVDPKTLWSDGLQHCVLRWSADETQVELLLYAEGRAVRFETCDSEAHAWIKAREWLLVRRSLMMQ